MLQQVLVSQQVASPLHTNHHSAIFNLDPANGGTALTTGTVYAQYNVTEESMTAADDLGGADSTGNVADFQFFRYEGGANYNHKLTQLHTLVSLVVINFPNTRIS